MIADSALPGKILPHHLARKAFLYVRQSSAHQVLHNRESSALQYAMRGRLTALGWSVGPGAIAAEAEAGQRRDQARHALMRDLEATRYAADRAFRQYDAANPANRLVTGKLEVRWNKALMRVAEVEAKIAAHDATLPALAALPASLTALAADLKAV
jgi:hypothetical protein